MLQTWSRLLLLVLRPPGLVHPQVQPLQIRAFVGDAGLALLQCGFMVVFMLDSPLCKLC